VTDITIPPEALKAAARAAMKDNGCGYTVNNQHILCDDPVCDGLVDPYGFPMKHECSCRSMARAACLAMLRAWPGMEHQTPDEWSNRPHIILPLPKENTND
jgi:hypothetical protein